MRAFNFSLIAVLSCIAVIGATPVENLKSPRSPVEDIVRRKMYAYKLQSRHVEVLT